jgi:hypothetical protein
LTNDIRELNMNIRERSNTNAPDKSLKMVEDAVLIEPVSSSNSLLTGKNTGNFADLGPRARISAPSQNVNSMASS